MAVPELVRVCAILLPAPLENPDTNPDDPEAVQAKVVPETSDCRDKLLVCPEHKVCEPGVL